MMSLNEIKHPFSGIFRKCLKIPALQSGDAVKYADELMNIIDREKSIDIDTASAKRDPAFSTDYLFSKAGGQMFGILLCLNTRGDTVILKAFSGQYNSRWTAPGWVPPVINPADFDNAVKEKDKEIKKLDRKIADLTDQKKQTDNNSSVNHRSGRKEIHPAHQNNAEKITAEDDMQTDSENIMKKIKQLKDTRKKISQELIKEIHSLYYLHNFRNEKKLMSEVFRRDFNNAENSQSENHTASRERCRPPRSQGMPCGTGDCCAPKLLNFAAGEGLIPLSLVEFYYGKENRSGTKKHKHFYPPCEDKCSPILGFMLSGLKELQKKYRHLIQAAEL